MLGTQKSQREAVATSRHGSFAACLARGREIRVDPIHERTDVLAHDLVSHEDDDRDCRQDQGVLGHGLAFSEPFIELAHTNIEFRYEFHYHSPYLMYLIDYR